LHSILAILTIPTNKSINAFVPYSHGYNIFNGGNICKHFVFKQNCRNPNEII
jgi:hypothetical protein